jgi:maltooligosyltrehalose trehalohydrolase
MTAGPAAERWQPVLGAWPDADGFRFRVWAPDRSRVDLLLRDGSRDRRIATDAAGDGTRVAFVPGLAAGARYGYVLDDEEPFPDPASRWQPDGVHDLSAIVDPAAFAWTDAAWSGVPVDRAVFYELHVGTFTPGGRFVDVIDRLQYLVDLGVTVVELMPVADFPGGRNWGYDGVSLFAPARCYGAPDDLRRLVDAAHHHGLAVVLDVVYNHFGPDGAYALAFSPRYRSTRHDSPWGAAVNFDGADAARVREFVIENALHWLHEYHLDGLRLDATHAIVDDSPRHVLAELAARARASLPQRALLLVAEDDRNEAAIVRPTGAGGWGMDAVWADDFHHQARVLAAGDRDGYYQDFTGETSDLAATMHRGWFYTGQPSAYREAPRGTDPAGIDLTRMVICLQNHDQIGNRAFGDRLHHRIDGATWRALVAVLLCAPETPLLFMGQEWAASAPFQYFTDHNPELGRLVTEGRRREFSRFAAFADDAARAGIPDPQARTTFEASRLDWTEREAPAHAATLSWHRALLALRRRCPALHASATAEASAPDVDSLVLERRSPDGSAARLAVRFRAAGDVVVPRPAADLAAGAWTVALTSEDAPFVSGPAAPVQIDVRAGLVTFARPGAVLFTLEAA